MIQNISQPQADHNNIFTCQLSRLETLVGSPPRNNSLPTFSFLGPLTFFTIWLSMKRRTRFRTFSIVTCVGLDVFSIIIITDKWYKVNSISTSNDYKYSFNISSRRMVESSCVRQTFLHCPVLRPGLDIASTSLTPFLLLFFRLTFTLPFLSWTEMA